MHRGGIVWLGLGFDKAAVMKLISERNHSKSVDNYTFVHNVIDVFKQSRFIINWFGLNFGNIGRWTYENRRLSFLSTIFLD